MTEKQRYLARDLEAWRDSSLKKIGTYFSEPKAPANIRDLRRTVKRANKIIEQWKRSQRKPWEKKRSDIYARYAAVRRVIIFESTEKALKAIARLPK